MTAPRIVNLSPEALNTCNRWQTITDPTQLTNEVFISTQAMLRDLSTQEDQTNTINDTLDENIQATGLIRELRTRIATQEATITAQRETIAALTTAVNTVQRPQGEEIPRPKEFDGTRSKLQSSIMQLRLHTASCTDEQTKLRLAINCLEGDALDQVRMYVQGTQVNLANLEALITILNNAFGNPNRVAEAEHKLNTIMQGSRDFCSYHAEFQRYASEVSWEEPPSGHHYEEVYHTSLGRL